MYKVIFGTNDNGVSKEEEKTFLYESDAIKFANYKIREARQDEQYYKKKAREEGGETVLNLYHGENEYSLTYDNLKTETFFDTYVFINKINEPEGE